ncbi:MAG: MFS transporter [Clostridia bacterium]|nr:MFS transporter [Clostridia bacterium]
MDIKNKTNLIYIHKIIKAVADSIIKVFIPLIILKASGNINYVMIYLCSYYFLCALLNIALKKFLQKYGVIAIILHSIPLIIMQILLNSNITWWICIILAILSSFAQVLYSVPINILFALTDKNINVAKFEISTNIGKIIFILLSGYILGSSIQNSLLIMTIFSAVLYIVSAMPLLFGYNVLKNGYTKISQNSQPIKSKNKLFNLYHILFGLFQTVIDVVLPLYLFINNLSFQSVTLVMVLIEVCKIAANIFARYLLKKGYAAVSIFLSLFIMVTSCVLMIFIKNAIILYICSCCLGVSFPLLFVPLFGIFIKKIIKDQNQFNGMTYRDAYIFSLRPAIYLPYFIFPDLILQLVLGIVCSVGLGFVTFNILKQEKNNNEINN